MLEWLQGYRAYRVWMGTIVLFLVSMVQSCTELKHSVWGKTATAEVQSVEPSSYEKEDHFLTLSFDDHQGTFHRIKRTVRGKLGPFTQGQKVEVIYLPGAGDRARLLAERSFIWPAIFLGMIGFAVIWSLVTYRRMEAGKL